MTGALTARTDVLALQAYVAGARIDNTIRLNTNESPDKLFGEDSGHGLNRYPEVHPALLRKRLADLFAVPADNLLVTRGSTEAIDILIRAWCRAYRDSMITTPPTFEMYRVYGEIQGAEIIEVPLSQDTGFAFDADAVLSACEPSTRLIFVCSPNNPTGTPVPAAAIRKIAEHTRGKSIVVVDEAYIEFANQESMADQVGHIDNLVVLRTLSKAHALAGARCGAAIACPDIIGVLAKVLPPYSFPTPVIDCVMAALSAERMQVSAAAVSTIIAERLRVFNALETLRCVRQLWPSQSNFLLVRFADLAAVQAHLFSRRILIRDFARWPALENCARITIGSVADNDALLDALRSFRGDN